MDELGVTLGNWKSEKKHDKALNSLVIMVQQGDKEERQR